MGAWKVIGYGVRAPLQIAPGVTHPNTISCDRCGACIKYVVTVKHDETGDVIRVGRDCAETLEGGPELAEIRRAQREYERAEWERVEGPKFREAAALREERRRLDAEQNAVDYATEMAACRTIITSNRPSDWEKDKARAFLGGWERGTCTMPLDADEMRILSTALRSATAPESVHAHQAGDKFAAEVVFHTMIHSHPDAQFPSTRYFFLADDGSVYVWQTATCPVFDKLGTDYLSPKRLGERLVLRGTVKRNGEYRGVKQTDVLRCKIAHVAAAKAA